MQRSVHRGVSVQGVCAQVWACMWAAVHVHKSVNAHVGVGVCMWVCVCTAGGCAQVCLCTWVC